MAVTVWLTRSTDLRGGRLGAVQVSDEVAAELIKKGDALPFDRQLRTNLKKWHAAEAERANADNGEPAPKKRGRPPKATAEPEAAEPAPGEEPAELAPDAPEPEAPARKGK